MFPRKNELFTKNVKTGRACALVFLALCSIFLAAKQALTLVEQRTLNERLFTDCYSGDLDGIAADIRDGACVNCDSEFEEGFMPLMAAAANGHLAAVRILVQHGADISSRDRAGRTAEDLAGNAVIKQYLKALAAKRHQ